MRTHTNANTIERVGGEHMCVISTYMYKIYSIYVYTHTHTHTHTNTHTQTHTHTHTHVDTYVYMYLPIYLCIYIHDIPGTNNGKFI
jgi:hypothetical protein